MRRLQRERLVQDDQVAGQAAAKQALARLANQWGLEPPHLDSLRHLLGHPSWKAYSALLESVADQTFAQLVQGLPHEPYLAKCGEIQMLQRIRDLPEQLIAKVLDLEDPRHARTRPEPDAGLRHFLNTPWYDSASADLTTDYALRARHVHTTGITPALSPAARELVAHAMQTLRAAGRSVSFDPNLRPSLWPDTATMRDTLNDLARHADWVLPGIDEGKLLTGQNTPADIAAWYLDRGAKAVVIKQGAQGAYFRTAAGEQGLVPGVPVPVVVDTVGAGDAFAVGIISAQLEGLSWQRALRRANWIASRALQVVGDMEGLPTRAELMAQNLE